MLGNPSESNLKHPINCGENPMHTPVDNHDRTEDPVTNRVTCRQTNTPEERPEVAPLITLMGSDSMDTSIEHNRFTTGAEAVRRRYSRQQLEELLPLLKERDLQILTAIRQCRFFTSQQVCRLIFLGKTPSIANTRAINRNLKKLRELGLIAVVEHTRGGVRGGSSTIVWYLTEAGERLLRLADHDKSERRARVVDPSKRFIRHTLAVAECSMQIREICERHNNLTLEALELEPACWRPYTHIGKVISLKPDLYAQTLCGEYEDRWFIEVDLATESLSAIIEQCRRYHEYYRSGLEQEEFGVFPLTVWIVPSNTRKAALWDMIRKTFNKLAPLFAVITPDELEPLLLQELGKEALC